MRLRLILLAALAATLAVLTACVADNRPETCDDDAVAIELTLTAEGMEPSDPAACRDQEVTLRIDSEVDGVVHIHGYDGVAPATEVSAGDELEVTFTALRSGQFPVEFHPADDPEGVSVGIFTVHEP